MRTKWLISIHPPSMDADPATVDRARVTQLHGPFDSDQDRRRKAGEVASDLGYPDALVFSAFDVVDGIPILVRE